MDQLRTLIVEDSELDSRILVQALEKAGYRVVWKRVETAFELRQALEQETWHLLLVDNQLPNFNAEQALMIVKELHYDGPFIIVSSGMPEESAARLMRLGAHDFIKKGDLSRLIPAIQRELLQAKVRATRRLQEQHLEETRRRYKTLWESSPDPILIVNEQGRIVAANPAVREVFGYWINEVEGKPLGMLVEGTVEQLRKAAQEADRQRPQFIEWIGRDQSGRRLELEVTVSDLKWGDEPCFAAFIRDVTQHRELARALARQRQEALAAREIQRGLFPKRPPEIPGFEVAGMTVSADETGGDFYDFFPMGEESVGIVVADVTGHNIAAALIMAETRAYLRMTAMRHTAPHTVFSLVNEVLVNDLADSEKFVTAFLLVLTAGERTIQYANAGHPPALIFDAQGNLKRMLKRTGISLGMFRGAEYRPGEKIQLEGGDLILLYTDGLIEAMSPGGELFGRERVIETVQRHIHRPCQELVQQLHQTVKQFQQGAFQSDDITIVAIRALEFR